MNHLTRTFLYGWMAATAFQMFRQDLYGLERYIELCRVGWIDLHWSFGLVLFVMFCILPAIDEHLLAATKQSLSQGD